MIEKSNFEDPQLAKLICAVLVNRLGGTVIISQTEIDHVAYGILREDACEHGIELMFIQRQKND